MVALGQQELGPEDVARGVGGGNRNFVLGQLRVYLKVLEYLAPVLEGAGLIQKLLVLNQAALGEGRLRVEDLHCVAEEPAEALPALVVHGAAHRPDQTEEKKRLQTRLKRVHFLDWDPLLLGIAVAVEKAVQIPGEGLGDVIGLRGHEFLAAFAHEIHGGVQVLVEQLLKNGHERFPRAEVIWKLLQPTLNQGLQPQRPWLHLHHAAARYGGGGGHGQILNFEHHGHCGREGEDLSGVEAELLVVVQDGVHALNPQCVDGAVADDPVLLRAEVFYGLAHELGQNSVSPLVGLLVELPVQLPHGDRFGVHNVGVDLLVPALLQGSHGPLEHGLVAGFPPARGSDQH